MSHTPSSPQLEQPPVAHGSETSSTDRSFVATWLLSWVLGLFGVDRFYLGKVGTGILKLITFGGLGVWWLVDLILVLAGAARSRDGRPLSGYDTHKKAAWIVTILGTIACIVFSSVSAGAGATSDGAAVTPGAVSSSQEVSEGPASQASDDSSEAAPEASSPEASAPAPAPAPEAVSAADWADSTYGTFTPVTQAGTGDGLVTLPSGAKAGIVTAAYQGADNFSVMVLDASNQSTGQLLVNTIGSYTGTTAYGFNALSTGVTLQVSGSGSWTVTISPVSAAPALPASGTGDGVFLYSGAAARLSATHDGSANFAMLEENGDPFHFGLLINDIGAYSGTVPLSAGPSVISITADGNWTTSLG